MQVVRPYLPVVAPGRQLISVTVSPLGAGRVHVAWTFHHLLLDDVRKFAEAPGTVWAEVA